MKEIKRRYYTIGSIFSIGRGIYIVRRSDMGSDRCVNCALRHKRSCIHVHCSKMFRDDGENVIFERI
nr:MAG TPA: hypothetical protein [Caudoviricetes sp.]